MRAALHDHPALVVLDTGSSVYAVRREFAELVGLSGTSSTVGTTDGNVSAHAIPGEQALRFADKAIAFKGAYAIDLKAPTACPDARPDVVTGTQFFRRNRFAFRALEGVRPSLAGARIGDGHAIPSPSERSKFRSSLRRSMTAFVFLKLDTGAKAALIAVGRCQQQSFRHLPVAMQMRIGDAVWITQPSVSSEAASADYASAAFPASSASKRSADATFSSASTHVRCGCKAARTRPVRFRSWLPVCGLRYRTCPR